MNALFSLLDAEVAGGQTVALEVARALVAEGGGVGLLVPADGPMVERFTAVGARTHVHALSSLKAPWAVPAVAGVLRGYDLLYSHTSVPGEILGDVAARTAGRPHVIHEHAPRGPHFSPRRSTGAVQRFLYRRTRARFIAVAPHVRDALVDAGVQAGRIDVVTNGSPDPSSLPAVEGDHGMVMVGMIGRLDRQKGIEDFSDAVAQLEPRVATYRVAARGPHVHERAIEERLRGASIALVESNDGVGFLSTLDVVALPSHYEGSPLALFEAMALGRAIVASDIPGIREVIEDGRNGLLVAPGDPTALAAAIQRLMDDEPLRMRLGAAAQEDAVDRFPMKTTVARCLDILREAIRRAGSARETDDPAHGDLR